MFHWDEKSKEIITVILIINNLLIIKIFGKLLSLFFADKGINNEKITLIKNGETLSKNEEIAENLNNYFSCIVTNLKLPSYEDPTINVENIADPVLKALKKYKNHPSIRITNDKYKTNSVFTFNQVSLEEIKKEIKNLNPSKASQSSDIPTKIIRQNLDLFAPTSRNESIIDLNKFSSTMKLGNIIPSFKKMTAPIKKITGLLVSYLICPKCLKNVYINSCPTFLKIYFPNINVGLERG